MTLRRLSLVGKVPPCRGGWFRQSRSRGILGLDREDYKGLLNDFKEHVASRPKVGSYCRARDEPNRSMWAVSVRLRSVDFDANDDNRIVEYIKECK